MNSNSIKFKSKSMQECYGEVPQKYSIEYTHFSLDVIDESNEEYKLIEDDIHNLYNYIDNRLFKIYFSNKKSLEKILKNTNLYNELGKYFYVRIHDMKDYEGIVKLCNGNLMNVVIFKNDLDRLEINKLVKNINIVLQVDDITELTLDELSALIDKNYNITSINLGQVSCSTKDNYWLNYFDREAKKLNIENNNSKEKYLHIEKNLIIHNDIFNVEQYKKIIDSLNNIVKMADVIPTDSDYDKLFKIYNYIINKIHYAYDTFNDDLLENQTILGGLFNYMCVCEGYCKLMAQLCAIIKIPCVTVFGGGAKETGGHLWNQVYINNNWYNIDATHDSYRMAHDLKPIMFLVNDESTLYKAYSLTAEKCDLKYDR